MILRRRSFLQSAAAVALPGMLASPVFAEGRPPLLIRNAKIVPVSGAMIPKGSVLIADGLISAVGASVTAPVGAEIIEGEGLTVYPGLIDTLSTLGLGENLPMALAAATARTPGGGGRQPAAVAPVPESISRGPEDRPLTTPWLKAADQVRPSDRRIGQARSAGFTSAVVFPTTGIFAGQGAVINLAGERSGQMVVDPSAGLYTTLSTNRGGGFPNSLMGVIAYLRQIYIDAEYYQTSQKAYQANPSLSRPEYDRALEGILEAPRTLFPAVRAYEIDRMIRLAKEFKTKPVFYGLHEGFRRGEEMAKAGIPAIINARWPEPARDGDPEDHEDLRTLELREKAPSTAPVFAKAGVKFTFSGAGIDTPSAYLRAIKRSIDAGLSQADALRAITLSAAEIFGVAGRLGSIEKGKIANLLVTKGELFADSTKVQFVLVDGVKYEPAPEETPARPEFTR